MGIQLSWLEHRTGTSPTQVRFPGAARDFSPRVNFQCRLSYGVRTPPCAIACIYIYAHVKDPVVHVRVRWIMETLNYPACTVAWVARPCRSWLSPAKETRISQRAGNEESHWDNTVVKRFLFVFKYFPDRHAILPRSCHLPICISVIIQ